MYKNHTLIKDSSIQLEGHSISQISMDIKYLITSNSHLNILAQHKKKKISIKIAKNNKNKLHFTYS